MRKRRNFRKASIGSWEKRIPSSRVRSFCDALSSSTLSPEGISKFLIFEWKAGDMFSRILHTLHSGIFGYERGGPPALLRFDASVDKGRFQWQKHSPSGIPRSVTIFRVDSIQIPSAISKFTSLSLLSRLCAPFPEFSNFKIDWKGLVQPFVSSLETEEIL